MDRGQAERMILDVYRARKSGDAVAMTVNCHDEVAYQLNAVPIAGASALQRTIGKAAVVETFAALMKAFIFENDWKVLRFIHDGDASVLIWQGTVTSSRTKKSHVFQVCDVITYKDGKISSITQHTDTASIAAVSSPG